VAKIKHTRNENGQNFTHQNKTTVFWRKKAKINLHHNFPIYGISSNKVLLILGRRTGAHREDCHPVFLINVAPVDPFLLIGERETHERV
jgi:hypothetical protein